jgi:hypothetical protein
MRPAVPLISVELANGEELNLTRGRHTKPPWKSKEATTFINRSVKSAMLIPA